MNEISVQKSIQIGRIEASSAQGTTLRIRDVIHSDTVNVMIGQSLDRFRIHMTFDESNAYEKLDSVTVLEEIETAIQAS